MLNVSNPSILLLLSSAVNVNLDDFFFFFLVGDRVLLNILRQFFFNPAC